MAVYGTVLLLQILYLSYRICQDNSFITCDHESIQRPERQAGLAAVKQIFTIKREKSIENRASRLDFARMRVYIFQDVWHLRFPLFFFPSAIRPIEYIFA